MSLEAIAREHAIGDLRLLRSVVKANRDRDRLVRHIRSGRARRERRYDFPRIAGSRRFIEEIEAMVKPRINLAIRPKKKRR